jgi:thiol-disulfide isomerase/thioredoxin
MQIRQVTGEELEVALADRDRPLIIDFYADWCGPCLLLADELKKVPVPAIHLTLDNIWKCPAQALQNFTCSFAPMLSSSSFCSTGMN